jgi:hypothetical protein
MRTPRRSRVGTGLLFCTLLLIPGTVLAQLTDKTQTPNIEGEGINKSLAEQVGPGRADGYTAGSSLYVILRDPFRAIRRGRQLFQRKFTAAQGLGPRTEDGIGDLNTDVSFGAGLADSCAACHGRPRGSAGFGGDVFTRPDSRDAPHLFGLGLIEMLADEMTHELWAARDAAVAEAQSRGRAVVRPLTAKGVSFGEIRVSAAGGIDASEVEGVDPDLRVRPFFAHGGTASIREFVVGAFNDEMGIQAFDPDLIAAAAGADVRTPSGMLLTGSKNAVKRGKPSSVFDDPDKDGKTDELPVALVDHMEFYLLNYFKPAVYEQTPITRVGRQHFERIGCASCHVPDLKIERDRRVADVETVYDPARGVFNSLFATAAGLFREVDDYPANPTSKVPAGRPFLVRNVFTDLKRHDLGPGFHERNFDGTITKEFVTEPLWGVGSTSPYGHDGRSINLNEVILRHGGAAQASRDRYARMPGAEREKILRFLESLVLFPPDDTASNLNPGNPNAPGYPQKGHGSIALTVLFNNPNDPE